MSPGMLATELDCVRATCSQDAKAGRNDVLFSLAVLDRETTSTKRLNQLRLGGCTCPKSWLWRTAECKQLYKILSPEQGKKLAQLQNENFGRFGMAWGTSEM